MCCISQMEAVSEVMELPRSSEHLLTDTSATSWLHTSGVLARYWTPAHPPGLCENETQTRGLQRAGPVPQHVLSCSTEEIIALSAPKEYLIYHQEY